MYSLVPEIYVYLGITEDKNTKSDTSRNRSLETQFQTYRIKDGLRTKERKSSHTAMELTRDPSANSHRAPKIKSSTALCF